jgi:hypothetical protein
VTEPPTPPAPARPPRPPAPDPREVARALRYQSPRAIPPRTGRDPRWGHTAYALLGGEVVTRDPRGTRS